jgi:hypothetical protein
MNNHTPGPWEAVDNPDDKLNEIGMAAVVVDKTGNIVSYVFHDKNGKPNMTDAMANADLIQVAPDLLVACKMAHRFIDDNYEQIINSILCDYGTADTIIVGTVRSILAAVIKKAEGHHG